MAYRWYALWIVAACVAVFALQSLIPSITDAFALDSALILQRPWTLITYIFLHGSIEHLFYNMFALALFGSILERIIGGKKFLFAFFASGIIAGVGSVLFYSASIGASGAIYGVMGTLAALRPTMVVWTGFVPLPMALAVTFWAAGDFLGFFSPLAEVAYAAHLFGLAFGLAFGLYLRREFMERKIRRENQSLDERELRNWEDRYLR
jgi:hypothetical protein